MFNFIFLLLNLKHLLIVLLVFELIRLNILFLIKFILNRSYLYLSLIFLIIVACEARMGLSLLIGVVRSNHLNYVNNSFIFII